MHKRQLFSILMILALLVSGVAVVGAQDDTDDPQPFLGVSYRDSDDGAVILEVVDNSPAAEAGLMADDVVTVVDGEAVTGGEADDNFGDLIDAYAPGDTITLTAQRGDETLDIEVTLGERPANMSGPDNRRIPRDPNFRFDSIPIIGLFGLQIEETGDSTVIVTEITPDSSADEAGLLVDDVIIAINGSPVATLSDVLGSIRPLDNSDTVTMTVERDGETLEFELAIPEGLEFAPNPFFMPFDMDEFPVPRNPQARGVLLGVQLNDADEGITVIDVIDGSPASEAGLMTDDVIVAVGETAVETVEDVTTALADLGPGAETTITVLRDGEETVFNVTLAEEAALRRDFGAPRMPNFEFEFRDGRGNRGQGGPRDGFEMPFAQPSGVRLGVNFVMLDENEAANFEVEQTEGAILTDIAENSPAATAGLQPGDIITAVDDIAITLDANLARVIRSYEPGDAITLTVIRGGEELTVEVTLGQPEQSAFAIP